MSGKNIILKAENISKQYRLGTVGTGTLSHDLNRWWHSVRGKEDPYLKVGEANDRTSKGNSEYVWALKDINFEVKEGEVLGIIGKNGAGKSTLLKILSKVTSPSTGSVKTRGRIASLLEVGTGFNPELTGRENIYLNGAILGMTKKEITDKLDEIITFSGCERYIDTPVKRYSSGMTVRLAFAVAAFLEPEILVVDEVLAVGDAEFQKKAIGKMQDISRGEGRTVLFVSHDMSAIRKLCSRTILLENGKVKKIDGTDAIISEYLKTDSDTEMTFPLKTFSDDIAITDFYLSNLESSKIDMVEHNKTFVLNTRIKAEGRLDNLILEYKIYDKEERLLTTFSSFLIGMDLVLEKGEIKVTCLVEGINFFPNTYYLSLVLMDGNSQTTYSVFERILNFEVVKAENYQLVNEFKPRLHGITVSKQHWEIKNVNDEA